MSAYARIVFVFGLLLPVPAGAQPPPMSVASGPPKLRGVAACDVGRRHVWTERQVTCVIRRVWPRRLEAAAIRVARCESRFDPHAKNRSSTASGVFQFLDGTWSRTPYRNRNVFNPITNTRAAYWLWRNEGRGSWAPWSCKP